MRLLEDESFVASEVHTLLRQAPLGFIDIGARGGVQPFADPVAQLAAVLAFEPDPDAIGPLEASLGPHWAQTAVENTALGGTCGMAPLYQFAHAVNTSLLPVNEAFRDRYRVASLAGRGQTETRLETLDAILFGRRAAQPFWGELLKLDAQGAEMDILRAAPRTLSERTVAIVAEVCFLEVYRDQPLFSQMEQFLSTQGFTFYGFLNVQGWSRKFIDKRRAHGRERLCFGDAVFFKDPLPGSNYRGQELTTRQHAMLYLCALLLGYYDFAIELAIEANLSAEEIQRRIRLAQRFAESTAADPIAETEALLARMRETPQDAAIELGRFVDRRRTLCDMSDAALPRVRPEIHGHPMTRD